MIGLPSELAIIPGRGAQAAGSEIATIRPAKASRGLRTRRDYVPLAKRERVKLVTNKLIANGKGAERPLNYPIGWAGGELAKW